MDYGVLFPMSDYRENDYAHIFQCSPCQSDIFEAETSQVHFEIFKLKETCRVFIPNYSAGII